MRRATRVRLTGAERRTLVRWSDRSPARRALRARIVLAAADGRTNAEIARHVGVHPETAARWRRRFVLAGVGGLREEAPRGVPGTGPRPELIERILSATLDELPSSRSVWSTRSLARSLGVNHMVVQRVWSSHGISPRRGTGPSGTDERPVVDVVAFFVHPRVAGVVFEVKSPEAGSVPQRPTPPSVESATTRLRHRVEAADGRAATEPGGAADSADLLVVLRQCESRAAETSQLNVVFDRPLESLPPGVGSWLTRHPTFRAFPTPAGDRWSNVVAAWVHRWPGDRMHPSSFTRLERLPEGADLVVDLRRAGWDRSGYGLRETRTGWKRAPTGTSRMTFVRSHP